MTAGCAELPLFDFAASDEIKSPFTGKAIDRVLVERFVGRTAEEIAAIHAQEGRTMFFVSDTAPAAERWSHPGNPPTTQEELAFLTRHHEARMEIQRRSGPIWGVFVAQYERPKDQNGVPIENPFNRSIFVVSNTARLKTLWHESFHPLWNQQYFPAPVDVGGKLYTQAGAWDIEQQAATAAWEAAYLAQDQLKTKAEWANVEFYSLRTHRLNSEEEFDVYYTQIETAPLFNLPAEDLLQVGRSMLARARTLGSHATPLKQQVEVLNAEIATFPENMQQRLRELSTLAEESLNSANKAETYLRAQPALQSLFANEPPPQ